MQLKHQSPSTPAELVTSNGIIVFSFKGAPVLFYSNGKIHHDKNLDKSVVVSFCSRHHLIASGITVIATDLNKIIDVISI